MWEPGEMSLTAWQWQLPWPEAQRLSPSLLCFWPSSLVNSSIHCHLRYKEGLADSQQWDSLPARLYLRPVSFQEVNKRSRLAQVPCSMQAAYLVYRVQIQEGRYQECQLLTSFRYFSLVTTGGILLFYSLHFLLEYNIQDMSKVHSRMYSLIKLYMFLYSLLAWAPTIKEHRRGCLYKSNLFSHSSGDWKSKIKMPAGSVSCEALFFGCRWLPSCCALTWWREENSEPFGVSSCMDSNPNRSVPPSYLI